MSNTTTTLSATLADLSREDLLALLSKVITGEVAQAPTEAPAKVDTRPVCGRTKSSDGQPCTRKATQEDGACKSHTGDWDNAVAEAKAVKAAEFVESRREARASGKGGRGDNKALAAALRAVGVTPNGEPWAQAKALVAEGCTPEEAAIGVLATA